MRFQVKTGKPETLRCKIAVVPVYADGVLGTTGKSIDKAGGKIISAVIKAGDISGKQGEMLLLTETGKLSADRVLLLGCGPKAEFNREQLKQAVSTTLSWLVSRSYNDALFLLGTDDVKNAGAYRAARAVSEVWHEVSYRFALPGKRSKLDKITLRSIALAVESKHSKAAKQGFRDGDGIGQGMSFTRDLGNTPANYCTPSYLVKQARALAKQHSKLSVEVLNEAAMKKLGMGALLSVTAGSVEPAKFIIMKYQGAAKTTKPVVVVGKGITFDTGGISLKPPAAMDEMKFDMSGAASAFGVMRAVAEIGMKTNLIVLIPTCENMPGGKATKPGDVVTSMSGQTIEVLNTDAEGRLILCDALTYAKRFKPRSCN